MQQSISIRMLLTMLFLVSNLSLKSFVKCIIFDEVQSVNVWLTVSSLANKDPNNKSNVLFRQIELNWINAPLNDDGDYIALYLDSEPDASGGTQPVSVHHLKSISGKLLIPDHYLPVINFYNETFQSGVGLGSIDLDQSDEASEVVAAPSQNSRYSFEPATNDRQRSTFYDNRWHQHRSFALPNLGQVSSSRRLDSRRNRQDWFTETEHIEPKANLLTDECIGYCVAYHSQGLILAKSCLKTQPNWMHDSHIGSRSLTTIAIAGTHNSGTYLKQRPMTHKIDKSVLQLINKYQLNQEESVFNQLVYGIRYLDLRVGYSKVKHRPEELWIYHDIFRTDNSLDEIFQQIRRFLELTSGEIVIVDFHRFTVGFQNEDTQTELDRHAKVLDLLFTTLGDYIVPSYLGQNGPLNEYISLGKRLIVGYAGRSRLLSLQPQNDQHQSLRLSGGGHDIPSTNYQKSQQQQHIRDVDADKQEDASNQTTTMETVHGRVMNNQDDHQEMPDRRIGTRVYNRLKSLKLISHSFSKRSIELHKDNNNNKPASMKSGNVYRAKQRQTITSSLQQPDRSMKIVTPLTAASMQSFNSKLSLLFNPVHHVWPNTDKEDTLKQFVEQSACRKYFGELHSLMAELTPTVFGAISDKYDGIRRLSSMTNRMVSDLIRSKFLHCINLVATDYFLGNDLIRLTIYANKMRQHHNRNNDLDSLGECKSFRYIKPLLERSKAFESNSMQSSSSSTTLHNSYQSDSGISDLFTSFFKRIFNL